MTDEHLSRMSAHDYFGCIDRAARANAPDEVRAIRGEVIRRWHGDPRADDLAEALYAHEERLAGHLLPLDAADGETSASVDAA